MFLIAALVLATVFVVLALFLNSAIYTENFATRGQATIDSGEAATFSDDLERNVGFLITELNEDRDIDEFSDLEIFLESNVTAIENGTALHTQRRGIIVDVAVTEQTEGTRIVQDSRVEFTDPDGNSNWKVVEDVPVRAFRFNISDASTTAFAIDVEDGTDDLTIEISDDGSNDIDLEVDGESCDAALPARVDITDATIEGVPCPALEPLLEMDQSVSIKFANGDQAEGTYELTTEAPKNDFDGAPQPTSYEERAAGDQPWAIEAVYDVEIEFEYQSVGLTYDGTLRVAPGEPR